MSSRIPSASLSLIRSHLVSCPTASCFSTRYVDLFGNLLTSLSAMASPITPPPTMRWSTSMVGGRMGKRARRTEEEKDAAIESGREKKGRGDVARGSRDRRCSDEEEFERVSLSRLRGVGEGKIRSAFDRFLFETSRPPCVLPFPNNVSFHFLSPWMKNAQAGPSTLPSTIMDKEAPKRRTRSVLSSLTGPNSP